MNKHKSISFYKSVGKWYILTPVPKNPAVGFGPVAWMDVLEMELPSGEIVIIPRHLRHYFLARPKYDGSEGGVRTTRVDIHRNFFIDGLEDEYCGRMMVMELELVEKRSKDYPMNYVLDYRPAPKGTRASHKPVFSDEKRSDEDLQIQDTDKWLHFEELTPYIPESAE